MLRQTFGNGWVFRSPPPKSKAEQQAAMEYNEALGPQLNEARQEAFPEHHAAACLIHERRCCVQQDRVMPPGMLDKGANPLVGVAGGLPCIAYSKVGLMCKTGDPRQVAFQVWRSERKHLASEGREVFFLFENVQGYPIEEKIAQEMQDTHHIVTLPFSPKDCACACLVMCSCCRECRRVCHASGASARRL